METHVYLHQNGGFPQIYKDAYPSFLKGSVTISSEEDDEILAEYKRNEVFRVDVLVTEE